MGNWSNLQTTNVEMLLSTILRSLFWMMKGIVDVNVDVIKHDHSKPFDPILHLHTFCDVVVYFLQTNNSYILGKKYVWVMQCMLKNMQSILPLERERERPNQHSGWEVGEMMYPKKNIILCNVEKMDSLCQCWKRI